MGKQGRNREVRIISSFLLPSADGLQSLKCITLKTPGSLGAPHRRPLPSPKAKPQEQELHQKSTSIKRFPPHLSCGRPELYTKQHLVADSLILILQDEQQSRRCVKPDKAMKINSSFSKANWIKSSGHNKASVMV